MRSAMRRGWQAALIFTMAIAFVVSNARGAAAQANLDEMHDGFILPPVEHPKVLSEGEARRKRPQRRQEVRQRYERHLARRRQDGPPAYTTTDLTEVPAPPAGLLDADPIEVAP